MAEYEAAHAAYEAPQAAPLGTSSTMAGTLNAALVRYYESGSFKDLAPQARQDMRRNLLERWRVDHGGLPLRPLRSKHIQAYISKLESKATQRNTLSSIRHFTKFALGAAMIDEDPALSVTRARMPKTGGFKTWSEEDLAQFEATYPIGTKERLAMALMLYLGVRRSDVVRIGPGHIKGGVLHEYLPKKGEHTGGNLINVPVHPELAKIIAATSVTGTKTFLVTSFGKPFTANGFGNWMRDRVRDAKLDGDPAPNHGLRKLCCVRLAEAGCTAPEIAAITGPQGSARSAGLHRGRQPQEDGAEPRWTSRLQPISMRPKAEQKFANWAIRLAKLTKKMSDIKGSFQRWRSQQDSNLQPTE